MLAAFPNGPALAACRATQEPLLFADIHYQDIECAAHHRQHWSHQIHKIYRTYAQTFTAAADTALPTQITAALPRHLTYT
jgi:hypothetical protein